MVNYEIRKIQEIKDPSGNGRSYTFIIPKTYARNLGIEKGDYVSVTLDEKGKRIILEKKGE